MDGKRVAQPSRLLANSLLECKDDCEDKYERCYGLLKGLTEGKGERECNDALNTAVAKDTKSHEDVCIGFIIAILVEPDNASKHYRHLTLTAKDGLHFVLQELNRITLDKFLKLKESVRTQLLWFTKEMIKNAVPNIDGLCWGLMRQIAGGDVNQKNLWLADSLMDIFAESRAWLEKYPFLLASVVYTYLRVIEDHAHANLTALRKKEVTFVVGLIRDRFQDVLVIGRDLVRLLQNIARIPEIEELWNDILYTPTNLSPTFAGLSQIMYTRTSRRFLQSRITPDMEKKLVFLTSQVRFGSHKRYQDWFQRTYLATLESQTLRCDLIRFIVGVIHPTNELLCSDIIPRWAVIGWLLTTCTNQVAASNAKLALFYDWLFYDQEKDNIMNIEPAILVMHHSMRPHPAITATLLDFLCRIIHNFCPAEAEKVKSGIYSSLRQIVDKRVLPSLGPLFDSQRLDRELRTMLKERFGAFLSKEEDEKGDPSPIIDKDDHYSHSEPGPAFSDDEDSQDSLPGSFDKPLEVKDEAEVKSRLSPPLKREEEEEVVEIKPEVLKVESNHARRNSNNHLSTNGERDLGLDQDVLDKLEELGAEKNCERRCEVMEQLVQVITSGQLEDDDARQLAEKLSEILKDQFEGKIFPDSPSPENIEDSIGQPLFVMFRTLCEINEIDPARTPLLTVLAELYGLQPRLGYYLLYYLKSYNQLDTKSRSSLYKDLMLAIDDNNSLDICLVNDMRQCQEDDVALFVWLCPDIYTYFQKAAIGNVDLLYLVVSCVDGRQIETLICHIIAKDFIMFKKDSFQPVISASLTWETFEQFALWQLLSGHDLPVDCLLPLLPKLSYENHAEALTHIMILLKREKPTADLVKHLMSREPKPKDRFVTAVLTCWINDYEDKLGDLLGSQLCKQASPAGGKRKRTQSATTKNSLGALAEMTLAHLDNLRQTCRQYDLFNLRAIQQALNTVRNICTDGQKKKFMDLFALADSESDEESLQKPKPSSKVKLSSKSPAKPKPKSSGGGSVAHTESSGDSSETEEEMMESTVPTKKGGKGRGSKPVGGRKRAVVTKVSYKDIASTDYSSEEDENSRNTPKKKAKKMKMSASDSD